MKILVVYFSRSGNTYKVADEIRNNLDCDIEELIDTHNRSGSIGYIRSVIHAIRKTPAILAEIKDDPAKYDVLIIGTPIWAGRLSTPVRAYIAQNHAKFNNVAFFATAIGPNHANAFNEMTELIGASPLATMGLKESELKDGSYKSKVAEFAENRELISMLTSNGVRI